MNQMTAATLSRQFTQFTHKSSSRIFTRLFSHHLPPPPLRGYTHLDSRRLISLQGEDCAKFLNGLITTKVQPHGFYTGFLNAKGRIVADAFIYPSHETTNEKEQESYVVECDSSIAEHLLRAFKVYKLRSKVEFSFLKEYRLWHVWDDSDVPSALESAESVFEHGSSQVVHAWDTRAGGFGLRLALPNPQTPLDVLASGFIKELSESDENAYKLRRTLQGVAEGASEMIPEKALPLEFNMDYMGGVDFEKGCYVGQELTIRSHHHGVVRKRVIPVLLSDNLEGYEDLFYDAELSSKLNLPSDELVGAAIIDTNPSTAVKKLAPSPFASTSTATATKTTSPRPAGSLVSVVGNVGLALVRLEDFGNPESKFVLQLEDGLEKAIHVQGFQPYWWPQEEE